MLRTAVAIRDARSGKVSKGRERRRRIESAKMRESLLGFALIAGVVFALVAGIWYFAGPSLLAPRTGETSISRVSVGEVAPDFTLPEVTAEGLTGKDVRLSSFRGKVVVLEFMVSWCHYCQRMAPIVGALHRAYPPDDVIFISVAGTFRGADAKSTAQFIWDHNATWIHVLDTANSVFKRYGVTGTPTYFIIDGNGIIRNVHEGIVDYSVMADDIEKLLIRG